MWEIYALEEKTLLIPNMIAMMILRKRLWDFCIPWIPEVKKLLQVGMPTELKQHAFKVRTRYRIRGRYGRRTIYEENKNGGIRKVYTTLSNV